MTECPADLETPSATRTHHEKRFHSLLSPLAIGNLGLSNRIVMAPMTRYFSPDGVPTETVAKYYARRASAGVGLLISEGAYVAHPSAHAYTNVPQFYGDSALAGWRQVLDAVHAAGGRIFPQLWHTGIARETGLQPDTAIPGFAPSEISGNPLAKAMNEEDIADIIDAYARSASHAQALGFDGVEIHGAHGYLIDTFFWHETNRREDQWGGALPDRARFGVEIVRAIRQKVGASFPISFRWSQFKQQNYRAKLAETPQALEPFLGALSDAGVSIFHVSTRKFWEPAFRDQSPLTLAGWTKKITGKPTIAVGSVGLAGSAAISGSAEVEGGGYSFASTALGGIDQLLVLEDMLSREEFDLIAIGRSLISDPQWIAKLRTGRLHERIPFEKSQLNSLD
jgi:2,4-dienoyl-CoA reductase-like NADH-dependent reductase (Old Yellow Enzyme family)